MRTLQMIEKPMWQLPDGTLVMVEVPAFELSERPDPGEMENPPTREKGGDRDQQGNQERQ